MYCSKCGKEHAGQSQYCPECSSPQVLTQPARKGRGMSIASMVLGICGIGLLAFILGIIALKQRRGGRGMAVAGVVLGAIATVVPVLVAVLAMAGYYVMRPAGNPAIARPAPSVLLANPDSFADQCETLLGEMESRIDKAALSHADADKARAEIASCRDVLGRLRQSGLAQSELQQLRGEFQEHFRAAKRLVRTSAKSAAPD